MVKRKGATTLSDHEHFQRKETDRMVHKPFLSLPRMSPERLEAYRAHFKTEFAAHAASQALELSRFRSRRLTQGEWDAFERVLTYLEDVSDPRVAFVARWRKIVAGLERDRFRVLNEPPRVHSVIEYLSQSNGVFALCRSPISDAEDTFMGAITVVHGIACREVVMEGLDLDRQAFDFMTTWHVGLVEMYRILKTATALRNNLLVCAGKDESTEVTWAHAAHITAPIMEALMQSREARSDAFYAPSGALMGVQITPAMIEELLPGIRPSV